MAAFILNAGVAWDQTPEYIALTDHVIPPGGQTAYTRFHPTGPSPADFTAFVYGQRDIHIGNWPEVMYMLFPTPAWEAFKQVGLPQQKFDANQQAMFERWPRVGEQARPLLNFPILPDSISYREELWRFDVWRKMDPRMSWDDMIMRIELPGRTPEGDLKLQNSIQTMLGRFWHRHYHMLSWFGKGRFHYNNAINPARVQILRDLANATPPIPLVLNTTKGITPGSINPAHGPNGTMVAWPNIRGGTIRGPRPAVVPPAALATPVVPLPAIATVPTITAPPIPPVTTAASLPTTAVTGTVVEVDDSSSSSSLAEIDLDSNHLPGRESTLTMISAADHSVSEELGEGEEDENEGTDAFVESHDDFSDGMNSPGTSSMMLDQAEAEYDGSDMIMGGVVDSEGEWTSTDGSDEDAATYSFGPGRALVSSSRAIPADTDATENPHATASKLAKRAAQFSADDEVTGASQPPAKRRRTGSGTHAYTTSHGPRGAIDAGTTTLAERLASPYQPTSSSGLVRPPSQTSSLANIPEPYRPSTVLPDTAATDTEHISETDAFFEESGELPPDGSFY